MFLSHGVVDWQWVFVAFSDNTQLLSEALWSSNIVLLTYMGLCVLPTCFGPLIVVIQWAVTCDFQQCCILTSVDSDEPVQTPFKLRNSKRCSVGSLTVIEYSSDEQRL